MKACLLLALAAVFLAGCGAPVRQASALQRVDGLTPILRATGTSATRLAGDWSRLAEVVRRPDVPGVERQAGVLLLDSNRLSSRAGTARVYLRHVSTTRSPHGIKEYVNELTAALSAEWWEGREAGWTARLLRDDPLLERGGDAPALARLEGLTRRSASRAVTYVAASHSLRRRERRLFRYSPVGPASSKGGTP